MTHLTSDETCLLRQALGLSFYCRQNPTRNLLFVSDAEKFPEALALLLSRGFLTDFTTHGAGGVERYYNTTDAGRIAVLDASWE